MSRINHTHDASRTSWVASANLAGIDFPIQNLPFAAFRTVGSREQFRGGIAIGDLIVDLAALHARGVLLGLASDAAAACSAPTLNAFLQLGPPSWSALRHALFKLLESTASESLAAKVAECLVPQSDAEYKLPTRVGDYTDFYTSYHHALNIGRLFSLSGDEVPPNFHAIPIGYHGRASSLVMSGTAVRRPLGQSLPASATAPVFGPCRSLDYELELGAIVGVGNPQGRPITLRDAHDAVFGVCLLNDWSARDIQSWEMFPLGPFQGKNFATSLSPWVVTMEALEPYRAPWSRRPDMPQPLRYLDNEENRALGALDIQLEVHLQTPRRRGAGVPAYRLSRSSFVHQHWTLAQMLAHHTVGGCNLQPGDLMGSGTISGPGDNEAGAMMEITRAGRAPVTLTGSPVDEEKRSFLEDGDEIILSGWCEASGRARIGFGQCRGVIAPALTVEEYLQELDGGA